MDKIEKIKGWVARDDDGTLAIHYEKPRRVCYYNNEIVSDGTPWVWENEAGYGLLPVKIFPDLKWEDEPLEVELTIKRVSTLSEEPNKSLEEAALGNYYSGGYIPKNQKLREVALKTKEVQSFIAGAEWQASQMLKDAYIESQIVEDGRIELEGNPLPCLNPIILLPYPQFKPGDKVRIVVLKEEEE